MLYILPSKASPLKAACVYKLHHSVGRWGFSSVRSLAELLQQSSSSWLHVRFSTKGCAPQLKTRIQKAYPKNHIPYVLSVAPRKHIHCSTYTYVRPLQAHIIAIRGRTPLVGLGSTIGTPAVACVGTEQMLHSVEWMPSMLCKGPRGETHLGAFISLTPSSSRRLGTEDRVGVSTTTPCLIRSLLWCWLFL
ncbi:uncharacterized protein LY79DRAFT_46436 [Colletotrichum navitas]|uniref:Uncharacterized protein n=1 Tax=Colletotrichum navitas TaxID=681940 RepID=A0AAD8PM28_9PEZI|nr:uncharacterized protein LY79DRAFT_46436 [Colletotrichum navitas]KAK1570238.1 hypothetical protein LY79DRAFT_46436 [Colletotrichum navitas]